MSRIRADGGKAEKLLRSLVWREGLRFRVHRPDLVGRPDIVFSKARVVIFVDGDFWHGRAIQESGIGVMRAQLRGARQGWWISKLRRNIARDRDVTKRLRSFGWQVMRLWETDVLRNPASATARVLHVVRRRNVRLQALGNVSPSS
jgi:DNA mismatch endonuclease (patch repair protein)